MASSLSGTCLCCGDFVKKSASGSPNLVFCKVCWSDSTEADLRYRRQRVKQVKLQHPNAAVTRSSEIIPHLRVGDEVAAADRDGLQALGVTHILVAGKFLDQYFPNEFTYFQINIDDDPSEDLISHLPSCLEYISKAITSGGTVLVHCASGISRSGSIAVAYLLQHDETCNTYDKALSMARLGRPEIHPNSGFASQLHQWWSRRNV